MIVVILLTLSLPAPFQHLLGPTPYLVSWVQLEERRLGKGDSELNMKWNKSQETCPLGLFLRVAHHTLSFVCLFLAALISLFSLYLGN